MSGLRKQIKDYSAVVTPASNDKLITQQASDNICRYLTPLQIIDLYATSFGKTLISSADAAAARATISSVYTGDLASQPEAHAGTNNDKWMSPLRVKQGAYYYVQNDSQIQQAITEIVPIYTAVPSSATVDLSSYNTKWITIQGTTTITSFGTGVVYDVINVDFDNNLTITDSANIICPGRENITTSAGDTAVIKYISANVWRITEYKRYTGKNLILPELISVIEDQKTQNTAGGTFTSGADRTRDINTFVYNKYGTFLVSLSANRFVIKPEGTQSFLIKWSAPAYAVDRHQTLLYRISPSAGIVKRGIQGFSSSTYGGSERSYGMYVDRISADTTYEIRHRCQTTAATNGFGLAADFGTEAYTMVEIYLVER